MGAVVSLVTPGDIATEMGREPGSLSSIEQAQLQRWINDAEWLIAKRLGDRTVEAEDLDYVVRQAVLAVAQAPTPGVTSESVQIDDGMVTTRYDRGPRRVSILPEWWSLLGVTDGGQAFSVDMGGQRNAHLLWCDLAFGGTSCSCGASIAGYPIYEVPTWDI